MDKKLILKGIDLIKGATIKGDHSNSLIYDAMPWQMVELKDKTKEWKQWNSDWFEWLGLGQVNEKYRRIIKNRMLASGILDMNDYKYGEQEYNYIQDVIKTEDTPLKKFYPLIPSFINVLRGESIKRDFRVYVTCTDRETENEKLAYKLEMVKTIVLQNALQKKQQSLEAMGLVPIPEEEIQQYPPEQQEQLMQMNQQYQQEMDTEQKLVEAEFKYKKYRHILEEYGQLVLNKDRDRFKMGELAHDAFIETLCNSEVAFHLEMLEDDYKPEFLDNAWTFSHQSPHIKYYSEGDYFGWFSYYSVGDIINKFGTKLSEEEYNTLQESVRNFADSDYAKVGIIPDQFRNFPGAYYDASKKYPNSFVDIGKYQHTQNNIIADLKTNSSLSSDQLSALYQNSKNFSSTTPKLFRVMRCYVKSQRKIGWLTKKDLSGLIIYQDWVDENFIVTEKPVYDTSLIKDKSEETLIYGEHIEWTWTNEWRHFVKININNEHPFWKQSYAGSFEPIYLDGERIKFSFSGRSDSPYDIFPPFEGVQYKMKGIRPVSPVELLTPFNILANIAFNRIPDIMFDDIGLALAINKNSIPTNHPGVEAGGDPLETAMENLRVNKVFEFNVDRNIIREQGNAVPLTPQILNLSRIQEGVTYLQLCLQLKEAAGEVIGISRQRLAQAKASETATQTQAGLSYSEVQTEDLFDRFYNRFMPLVYQKMIEAALYYSTISGKTKEFYQNDIQGNTVIDIENLDGMYRKYHIHVKSDIRTKELKQKLEQLFIQNNTTDTSMFDLAQGLIEDDPSIIIENLRKATIKKEEAADKAHQQQMELQQQSIDAAKENQLRIFEQEQKLQQMKNESNEQVALIRALGGVQTDNNKDGQIDAFQNLQLEIKNRALQLQNNMAESSLDFKKKQHEDLVNLKKDELNNKMTIEQKRLAVALANQNKYDDKPLNKEIAKKQGIK